MTELPGEQEWLEKQKFTDTSKIKIPKKLIDHVIGQDDAVTVAKKAALQRRHVLLIGEPGTGKSMLANAMAELLPLDNLEDVIVYPNEEDPNNPKVRVVPRGKGKAIVDMQKAEAKMRKDQKNKMKLMIIGGIVGLSILAFLLIPDA
ncbi:MAG: ATP-binding protein, partial [bacterium]|nr:ATP-binding protein [bacterium]